jgi:hypothetical protein
MIKLHTPTLAILALSIDDLLNQNSLALCFVASGVVSSKDFLASGGAVVCGYRTLAVSCSSNTLSIAIDHEALGIIHASRCFASKSALSSAVHALGAVLRPVERI